MELREIEDLFDAFYDSGLTEAYLASIVLLACMIFGPVCVFAAVGDRQQREAGGSNLRLWSVALAAAGLGWMPLGIGLIAYILSPDTEGIVLGGALVLSIAAWIGVIPICKPPLLRLESDQPLPLVTDADFLSRMAELAARMKLRLPTIRVLRSSSAEQQAMAWAGGLPQPSLVVSDGILHRIDPLERDATLAHEMAHIVNGSLWVYAAFFPLACTIGVVALACRVNTWMWIVPAAYVGVWRILSRRIEYDCDLRAARAIGFPETANALL
jgi:Zn-dependent protease with chaperone function